MQVLGRLQSHGFISRADVVMDEQTTQMAQRIRDAAARDEVGRGTRQTDRRRLMAGPMDPSWPQAVPRPPGFGTHVTGALRWADGRGENDGGGRAARCELADAAGSRSIQAWLRSPGTCRGVRSLPPRRPWEGGELCGAERRLWRENGAQRKAGPRPWHVTPGSHGVLGCTASHLDI